MRERIQIKSANLTCPCIGDCKHPDIEMMQLLIGLIVWAKIINGSWSVSRRYLLRALRKQTGRNHVFKYWKKELKGRNLILTSADAEML